MRAVEQSDSRTGGARYLFSLPVPSTSDHHVLTFTFHLSLQQVSPVWSPGEHVTDLHDATELAETFDSHQHSCVIDLTEEDPVKGEI